MLPAKIWPLEVVTVYHRYNYDFSETSIFDTMASTENLVLITQLKDEVESLKKQLALKEQQLLEKDKNVSKYTTFNPSLNYH